MKAKRRRFAFIFYFILYYLPLRKILFAVITAQVVIAVREFWLGLRVVVGDAVLVRAGADTGSNGRGVNLYFGKLLLADDVEGDGRGERGDDGHNFIRDEDIFEHQDVFQSELARRHVLDHVFNASVRDVFYHQKFPDFEP